MIEHSNVNYVLSTIVSSMQKKLVRFEKLGSPKRELHDINTDANIKATQITNTFGEFVVQH